MKLLFPVLISITFLISCTNSSNKIKDNQIKTDTIDNKLEKNTLENDFQGFISLLPQIDLPYLTYCLDCCEHPEIDFSNKLFEKYLPEGSYPVGIVSNGDNFVSILVTYPGDMMIPTIVIYDLNGKIIDEKHFMTKFCGREYDSSYVQYLVIYENLNIREIESVFYLEIDSLTNEITDTINLELSETDYLINKNGKIIEK